MSSDYANTIRDHALRCALFPSWWRRAWFRARFAMIPPRDYAEWFAYYEPPPRHFVAPTAPCMAGGRVAYRDVEYRH